MPPTPRFRKFRNEKGKLEEFTIFLIHGHSKEWQKVDKYIRTKLKFKTLVSVNQFRGGTIYDKIRRAIWFECDCAVAILSPDDQLKSGQNSARPNVIWEMGYCQGFWDHYYWEDEKLEPVILIKENSVAINSDLNGIEVINYDKGKINSSYEYLKEALENIFNYLNED